MALKVMRALRQEIDPSRDDALKYAIRLAAHELLEPIVMAEACLTLVHAHVDAPASDDAREPLEAAHRALSRSRVVVEAILLDAVEPDRELVLVPVDLPQIAADCVRLLEAEIAWRKATVRIGPLPTVNGDPALLGAVLNNLLLNGLKYGPPQGAIVDVSAERRGDVWRIAVASRGPAVPEDARTAIFLPYTRGRRSGTSGAGLGLAICRRIVERHGGHIDVERGPSDTNVFAFTLPA